MEMGACILQEMPGHEVKKDKFNIMSSNLQLLQ